jgi:NAD(P)H-hydrate repair Nnr-like enzyme with NAD(P)H-hydrate dehydratase domain
MLLICGTVPLADSILITGKAAFDGEKLLIAGKEISCTQGTAALVSAACVAASHCGIPEPQVALAGDCGNGKGSRLIYNYLIASLAKVSPAVLVLHYILPVMGLMKKVCDAAGKCPQKPVMIADASSMYAAKAAGLAPLFDIFTPDLCEMAFLADPEALHPAYVSRHLFGAEIAQAPELIASAFRHKNAARTLLLKGATDHVIQDGKTIATIDKPDIPAMEAIGGTGDTISGMVGAFVAAGFAHTAAAILAAKANRRAAEIIGAKPATKIREIIAALPAAINDLSVQKVSTKQGGIYD